MPPRERATDRGTRRGRAMASEVGREIRTARRGAGLTQDRVGAACGISGAYVSRIESGLALGISIMTLSRVASVVGLDLTLRTYPGESILRDVGHRELLLRLRKAISPELGWRTEVPLPNPGDQRAWDVVIVVARGTGDRPIRIGVEAETRPRDAQALQRRLALKRRDGGVDHVLLVLAATRGNRDFLREAGRALGIDFPLRGRDANKALAAGRSPDGSAIILM
jgi:transcriptional regulator with XRE-family HTH domain